MPTQKWLSQMIAACKERNEKGIDNIQCEIICKPLLELFPNTYPEELHYELLQNGLFEPHEWVLLEQHLQVLKEMKVWQIVQEELERLKKRWSGPDVPIYIFPITRVNNIANKNGVAYQNAVFLFVSEMLETEELRALFAHEYNHVCRLHFMNKTPDEMMLKDSLILEGLAECAVEELYGNKWLAPWLKLYSMEDIFSIWRKDFLPSLDVLGMHNHFAFLYGGQLPKWIGYCMGYEIVRTYKKNYSSNGINIKSTEEILAGSDFPLQ